MYKVVKYESHTWDSKYHEKYKFPSDQMYSRLPIKKALLLNFNSTLKKKKTKKP